MQTPAGLALDKLDSSMIISGFIILLTIISGARLSSIYSQKGNLKQGLTIGLLAFLVAAAGSPFIADLYGAQNLSLARIMPWVPWILIFIAGNSFNEELLFRGLFLCKFEAVIGKAKELLIASDISLTGIAKRTGFLDSNALIRAFKKIEEMTPGNYREQIKQKPID